MLTRLGTQYERLQSLKIAVMLEKEGFIAVGGESLTDTAREILDMGEFSTHDEVMDRIQERLDELLEAAEEGAAL
jgi:hypothetical protein